MAWLKPLGSDCLWPGCDRRATVELMSNRNDPMGKYCVGHGKKKLAERQAVEKVYR
jgi:hypothetical protein